MWGVLVLLLQAGAVADDAASARIWKRPLRTFEYWNTLQDVLQLSPEVRVGLPTLPPLPQTLAQPQVEKHRETLEAYRQAAARIAQRVFHESETRPVPSRWRVEFEEGGPRLVRPPGRPPDRDPFAAAQLVGGRMEVAWSVLGGASPGEAPGLSGAKIGDQGLYRFTLRVGRGATPIAARHHPCRVRLLLDGLAQPLIDRALEDPEGRFQIVEGEAYLTQGQSLGLSIVPTEPRGPSPEIRVDHLEIEGPLFPQAGWPPPSQARVLFDSPLASAPGRETEYLEAVAKTFLRRALRRPPMTSEWEACRAKLARAVVAKQTRSDTLKNLLVDTLASPAFLYLEEHTRGKGPLTPFEFAARLSYAVLGTTPSDELLDQAEQGTILIGGLPTLLEDPRSRSWPARFASVWLDLERLPSLQPDRERYAGWDEEFIRSATQEAQRFASFVCSGGTRPPGGLWVTEALLVDERLARHYDLLPLRERGVKVVPIKPSHGRVGLATQAGLLALSCDGRDENLGKRGQALARKLLAAPGEDLPLGLDVELNRFLEPYDALGRWRKEATAEQPLKDTTAFRQWLLARSDRFRRAFLGYLFSYAIGYDLPPGDPALDRATTPLTASSPADDFLRGVFAQPRAREKW